VAAVASVPGHSGTGWQDVERIDVRPEDGVAKVILHSRTEVQVDLATGKVLQVGYRTSDFIETIHDFSILGGFANMPCRSDRGSRSSSWQGPALTSFCCP
jgi:hypothetical protein